ncbi:MAG: cupin domain-containing protein [Galactobacter sp.]
MSGAAEGNQASALRAGVVFDGLAAAIDLESLGSAAVSGSPEAGVVELGTLGETEFGLWEHSVGTSTDVEADEVFVVLTGRGTVEIEAFGDFPAATLELRPGSVVRLAEGMRTTWNITETLRKLYVA